ncbi:MAG TPA: complex I subunit 5 family protein [Jatrophihabitans sp.]|nr:complex I subunit 5 family protein [Jatrophihabitans sp.]
MTAAGLLPLAVLAPLVGGAISPLLARWHRRLPLLAGLVAVTGALALLLVLAVRVYRHGPLTHFFSGERPVAGQALGIAFTADPFGMVVAITSAFIGLILLVSLLSEFGEVGRREVGGLAGLVQLLLAALIAAALTADLINLFVWFEVAALASYGLTGFLLERPIALEAAFKLLVLTSTGGFAVFIGAAMLYDSYGALNLGQLHIALGAGVNRSGLVAGALLVGGFAVKAGLVPFHAWLPDAHTPVPGAISALFSGLMVNLGAVGLVRLAVLVYPLRPGHHLLGLLMGFGLASALLGALLALVQDDLKRLLAWDTVSQIGLLLLGFASHTQDGMAGATFHLINHALFKTLLFLCAGAVVHATGATSLSQMGGLLQRRPLLACSFVLAVLAISGVPGFNGYVSLDLIHRGLQSTPVLEWFARLAQVITVAALSRGAYLGFLRRRPDEYDRLDTPRLGMRISLLSLATICLGFGVFGRLLVTRVAAPAAAVLGRPDYYARAALGLPTGPLPGSPVEFHYFAPGTLLPALVEIALGLLLAAVAVRWAAPIRPIGWLQRLHTGSVNDYAMCVTAGFLITGCVLLL